MYKTGIYIMYMYRYVHTLLSHDKCFEIPTCTDSLNKQNLVTGSGFLIDVHGTHGLQWILKCHLMIIRSM